MAFITEGDPLVYSSASRLLELLRIHWPEIPLEVVPGVTSLTAAASRCLVQSEETLVVIPACHHPDRLERLIETHDRVALLKVGSVFPQIVALLERRKWLAGAIYVEKVGTPQQRIERDVARVDPATVSYFSMVLIDAKKA